MKYIYSIENDKLKSFSKVLKKTIWSGKPYGVNVVSCAEIPDSDDCIVLLEWEMCVRLNIKNILRINPEGRVIWKINRPDRFNDLFGINRQNDTYLQIYKVSSSRAFINTYSGFLDSVDLDTGMVVDSEFVK